MTTVVYSKGLMVSDGRVTQGSTILYEDYSKISVQRGEEDRYLIGMAGHLAQYDLFFEWAKEDFERSSMPCNPDHSSAINEVSAIVVRESDLKALYYDGEWFIDYGKRDIFIGSGADAAQAAMIMGSSPVEAVKLAALMDAMSNNKTFMMTTREAFG